MVHLAQRNGSTFLVYSLETGEQTCFSTYETNPGIPTDDSRQNAKCRYFSTTLNKPPFHADRRTSGKVQREAQDLTSEAKGSGKEASKAKGV